MPDSRENLGFGVVSGDLGRQKAFAQIATLYCHNCCADLWSSLKKRR